MKTLLIVANNNLGSGQSGGDTIFINFVKYWYPKLNISILGSAETNKLLRTNLKLNIKYNFILTDSVSPFTNLSVSSLIFHQLRRLSRAIFKIITLPKLSPEYIYSSSDFLSDLIPSIILKLLNPSSQLIAGYYLIVPHPKNPNSPYRQSQFKAYLYYLTQKITLFLVNRLADYVFITSSPDKKYFPHLDPKKIIVVRGGVDTSISQKYFKTHSKLNIDERKYDAVFQGRLHPQKGVLPLIDIWQKVTKSIPNAKLAIIGDGELYRQIQHKIKRLNLNKNISLLGFQTGKRKYEIFQNSKIVLHPAIFDSGGMSAAEAMAWGLPGVSYDLEALKEYYPVGMIKTPCFNQDLFAHNIIHLLTNKTAYNQISTQAQKYIYQNWDWKDKSQEVLNLITSNEN